MTVQLNFDARQVQPSTGQMDPVPAGWYDLKIDDSDMKPTRDGTSNYLKLRFEIISGQYAGRKLFTNLNIGHANPQAKDIALRDLSAIAHSVGVLAIENSMQLHGIPLKARVSVKPAGKGDDGETYEAQNVIKAYRPINFVPDSAGAAPAAVAAPSFGGAVPAAPPAAPAGWGAPPAAAQPPAGWGAPPAAAAPPAAPAAPWGGGAPPAQPWGQPPAGPPAGAPPGYGQPPAAAPAGYGQPPAGYGAPGGAPSAVPPWQQPK